MLNFSEYLEEGKRGLWDNIHAKRKRIKNGSGERMRKPGSKGAPTAADFKAANEELQIDEAGNKSLEPHIGMGDSRTPRELKTQMKGASDDFVKSNASKKPSVFHSKVAHMQHKLAKSELRKRNNEELSTDEQFDLIEEVVVEGAYFGVALAPIDIRNPKKAPQPYRNQGDIVPPTKPPSTEKRGVKGRPGQRPMPTHEELSADEQFDLIEELVMDLAETNNIDPESIWETLESVDDTELLEYAVDAKGHKSSTGGLTQKGRDAYNAKGGNLQAPVTTPPSKLKPGSKAANRRKSFCARMGGMEGPMKDDKGRPTRKALALRKWNC